MYKIVESKSLAENIYLLKIEAKYVARACEPGQFLIVRCGSDGERIPLTICDYNRQKETVTIVYQVAGATTEKMRDLKAGGYLHDVVGPLGKCSEFIEEDIESLKNKKFVFIAGGVGAAPVYPQVKWMRDHGIDADVILGAKNKDMLILKDELQAVADNLYITTDDGSYGDSGMVTTKLQKLYDEGKKYDVCIAIGPMIMMKFVCMLTKELDLHTVVSLNPIMVDGTGMCGACRVSVGDKVKFACVDGPEFDGHLVNFDEAMRRQRIYKTIEGREFLKIKEGKTHHGGCGNCSDDSSK